MESELQAAATDWLLHVNERHLTRASWRYTWTYYVGNCQYRQLLQHVVLTAFFIRLDSYQCIATLVE